MKIFAYRLYGDDRDACAYIDDYWQSEGFSRGICGPCYSCRFGMDWNGNPIGYEEVETFLTREEFEEARDNGFTDDIIAALASPDALAFADAIMYDEKLRIMSEHHISSEDADFAIAAYDGDYRDRGVVSVVFDSWTEAAEDEAWQLGYVNDDREGRYFNYEALAEDLQDDCTWIELPSGKVLHFAY